MVPPTTVEAAAGLVSVSVKSLVVIEPSACSGAAAPSVAAGGVVVGPMKTNQVFFDRNRQPVSGTVPQVLEYGGQITILEWFRAGVWQRADLRSLRRFADLPTRYRTVNIAARPFMHPALRAERQRLPELFRDTVR